MRRESTGWQKHLDFIILDLLCLHIAYILAYCMRFGMTNPYHAQEWRILIIVMTLLDLLVLVFGNVLRGVLKRGYIKEAAALIRQDVVLELLAIFFLFAVQQSSSYSRIVVILTGIFHVVIAWLVRIGWKHVLRTHFRDRKRHVLLVGGSELAQRYNTLARKDESLRQIEIIGYLAESPCTGIEGYAGDMSLLEEYLKGDKVDEVVLALTVTEEKRLVYMVNLCEKYGVRVRVIPFYNDVISSNPRIECMESIKLLNFRATPLDEMTNALIKRCVDIVASAILIVLTSPIMVFAAIGTRLSSPGPVLFMQERVGRGKKTFRMAKFRSMRVTGTEDTGWSTQDDPRKTKFGSFMRKFSIDELPQLFNVLAGQMSLIGPRPEVPFHVDHFKDEIPLYLVRQQVRPGITGWAQVNGLRGDTSIEERVKYDIWYIENWSLSLDIKIVWKTVFGGLVNQENVRQSGVTSG